VQYYLTPEQQIPFGHSSILVPDDTPIRASHSPAPASGASTPAYPGSTQPVNLLRTLTKAYNTRNGPLFIRTVNIISDLLAELRPAMRANLRNKELWPGIPPKVWSTIVEECYHRSVGPKVEELTKYVPFSDNVYGELNASFISDIIHRTGLGPGNSFVDLGCGVGNCLIQASLQSGCTSKGIELLSAPANLAHAQHTQFLARLRKWGLSSGEVIVRTGDFCEHPDVKSWMVTADVVLVNNWAFSAQLNERLSLLFLDLPDHAKIISLKPFVPSDFKLNQRTIDSPLAILRVEEHPFRRGAVSWTGEGGVYYLHTIDRRRICEFLENGGGRPTRPTRSRR
jgi:H3 lysine-79-specific histone-lysine N-methyltransferase